MKYTETCYDPVTNEEVEIECERLSEEEWCEKRAKAFFATKEPKIRYRVDVFSEENANSLLLELEDDTLCELRKFVENTRVAFAKDECPSLVNNRDGWTKWLENSDHAQRWKDHLQTAYAANVDIDPFWDSASCEVYAGVRYVDLDNPLKVYCFHVNYFLPDNPSDMQEECKYIHLTDGQYIELVASCLNDPDFSACALIDSHPELFMTVMKQLRRPAYECAVFLTEAKQDAAAIAAQCENRD